MNTRRVREVTVLAVAGAAGFWLANFAISLTPVAADYRSGLGISYVPMLVESLVGGLIMGFGVAYCLLRFFDRIPTRNPVGKALVLAALGLVLLTVVIEVPAKLGASTPDAGRYFLIALAINVIRVGVLAWVIGFIYGRIPDRRQD